MSWAHVCLSSGKEFWIELSNAYMVSGPKIKLHVDIDRLKPQLVHHGLIHVMSRHGPIAYKLLGLHGKKSFTFGEREGAGSVVPCQEMSVAPVSL